MEDFDQLESTDQHQRALTVPARVRRILFLAEKDVTEQVLVVPLRVFGDRSLHFPNFASRRGLAAFEDVSCHSVPPTLDLVEKRAQIAIPVTVFVRLRVGGLGHLLVCGYSLPADVYLVGTVFSCSCCSCQ